MRRAIISLAGLLALVTVTGWVRAEASQPAPASVELEIVEQGFQWFDDEFDGTLRWGVLVRNPNPDTWVASATVEATFADAAGTIVGFDSWSVGHVGPGQTRAAGSIGASVTSEPASMTVQFIDLRWTDEAELGTGEITAALVGEDRTDEGYRHIVASVQSTLDHDVVDANVLFIARDRDGALLGVHPRWTPVPAGAEVGAEMVLIGTQEMDTTSSVEVDVDWYPPSERATGVLPLEVVEVGGGWYQGTAESGASWGAIIRNPNGDGWVAEHLAGTATFRDADGRITGSDWWPVGGTVLPGETIAIGTDYTWAPESASIDVSVIADFTQFDVLPATNATFEDVVPQYEGGGLSAVTAVMTVAPEYVGEWVELGVIYRDDAGQIVGGRAAVERPEAVTTQIEIAEWNNVIGVATVELYGTSNAVLSVPAAGQFRPTGTFSPEVAAHIPAPSDISTDPPVVYANLILAALAVLTLSVGVRMLNATLVMHEEALEGLLRPAKALGRWWSEADQAVARRTGKAAEAVRVGGVLLFYGVLFSFLEPGWRPWTWSGLFVLAVMTIAFGAVGTGDDMVELRSARRWGLPARLVVKPALVLFALSSVALTKFAGLVPGLMVGTPEAFSMEEKASERDETRLALVGLGSTAALGLGAWALAAPLDGMLDGSGGFAQGALSALVTLLVLIFAVAVENLFANLLPFAGSEGSAIRRSNRAAWWVVMVAVTALFFHTLINPTGELGESLRSTNVRVVLFTVGAFLLVTATVYLAFRRLDRQQAAAAPPVPAVATGAAMWLPPPQPPSPPPPTPATALPTGEAASERVRAGRGSV